MTVLIAMALSVVYIVLIELTPFEILTSFIPSTDDVPTEKSIECKNFEIDRQSSREVLKSRQIQQFRRIHL